MMRITNLQLVMKLGREQSLVYLKVFNFNGKKDSRREREIYSCNPIPDKSFFMLCQIKHPTKQRRVSYYEIYSLAEEKNVL